MLSDEYSNLDSSDVPSFDEKLREKYRHMIAKISELWSFSCKRTTCKSQYKNEANLELTKSRLEDDEELIIKSIIVIMRGY